MREALEPLRSWLIHITATGSRRLDDSEYPPISGAPTMGQLRAATKALSLPSSSAWLPIEDAPRNEDFLALIGNGYISRARFLNGKFFSADSFGPSGGTRSSNTDPIAWQPLPAPPETPRDEI